MPSLIAFPKSQVSVKKITSFYLRNPYSMDIMSQEIVKVTSKGQVIIPASLREKAGLKKGSYIYQIHGESPCF
ncbi:MAG: AbrB/MazE/SpoVT family DNA-binding domain-containing protein [Nitrososphaerales archaeon]